MDLTPYVTALGNELAATAETGGPEARALAERLAGALESAVRLNLLDALSDAASEITRDLAPGSVELRLRGREPSFMVTLPPADQPYQESDPTTSDVASRGATEGDDSTMTRINLRLGQDLKDRVEEAAREAGLSVNAWLVRSAAAALEGGTGSQRFHRRPPRGPDSYSGWVS